MLTKGQAAPNFTLPDKNQQAVSLADFKGQKVVIYFYPKDDTPGCTVQACAFKSAYADFTAKKIVVLGISRDSAASHQKFAEKYALPFILLADEQGTVVDAYDVKGPYGASRTTFIIDENALIEKVFEEASPDTNAAEILAYLAK